MEHSRVVDDRSTRQIREEIARTRRDMDFTIGQLRDRLSSEHVAQRAVHTVREMVSDPAVIVDRLQRNPLPAAVTVFGLGWLLYRSTEHERFDSWAAEKRIHAGQRLHHASDRLRQRSSDLALEVSETVHAKKEQMRHKAREAGQETQQEAGEWIEEGAHRARRAGADFGHSLNQLMRDNPLGIGALALAVGSAAALSMPHSRREDELMGPIRDELIEKAQAGAEQGIAGAGPPPPQEPGPRPHEGGPAMF